MTSERHMRKLSEPFFRTGSSERKSLRQPRRSCSKLAQTISLKVRPQNSNHEFLSLFMAYLAVAKN